MVQGVLKNLREYWGNIGIIAAMLINTLMPVVYSFLRYAKRAPHH